MEFNGSCILSEAAFISLRLPHVSPNTRWRITTPEREVKHYFHFRLKFPKCVYSTWGTEILYCNLGNRNYFSRCFLVVFACEKVSQRYFISFVHPVLSAALQPWFQCVLAFAQWLFVLVQTYQVMTESDRVESSKIRTSQRAILCSAMRFAKIQLRSQGCVIL